MPKPRLTHNKGLPERWQFTHGAYYFRVPNGFEMQWEGKRRFRLGATLPEAFKVFAARIDAPSEFGTIGDLLDRYALEVVPTKAPKTAHDNVAQIKRLRTVFGHMPLTALEPHHVYRYVDKREAKTAARREVEVLSHVFTKAVEWGVLRRHPFKGEVRLKGMAPRSRYVEDWEVVECLSLKMPSPLDRSISALSCSAMRRARAILTKIRVRPARSIIAGRTSWPVCWQKPRSRTGSPSTI